MTNDIVDAVVVEDDQIASPPTTETPGNELAPTTGDPILDKILAALGPVKTTPRMKLLIFGEPGSGKSSLAGTAPQWPLYIDADEAPIAIPHIAKSPGYFRFKSVTQVELLTQYLKQGYKQFDQFETIILDPVNEVHKSVCADIARRDFKAAGGATPDRPTPFTILGKDHGEANERVRQLITDLRHLDRNLIVISHTKYVKEQGEQGATTYMLDMSERLGNTLAGMFDLVGYLKQETDIKDNTASILTIRSSGAHKVKTRVRTMPTQMTNPTWPKLYARFEEYINSVEVQQ